MLTIAPNGKRPAASVRAGGHATLAWAGGPDGLDRPLDEAFVRIERSVGDGWREVDSDLGLDVVWRADGDGAHTATWSVPRDAAAGTYRLVVTATRYRLVSRPFAVTGA